MIVSVTSISDIMLDEPRGAEGPGGINLGQDPDDAAMHLISQG